MLAPRTTLDRSDLEVAPDRSCKTRHVGDDFVLVPIEGNLDGRVDRVFFVELELEVLAEELLQLVERVRERRVVQLVSGESADKGINTLLAVINHDDE